MKLVEILESLPEGTMLFDAEAKKVWEAKCLLRAMFPDGYIKIVEDGVIKIYKGAVPRDPVFIQVKG